MKKINLNNYIKVKLTDHGKDIYFHTIDDLVAEYPLLRNQLKPYFPKVDENGFTEFQLWDFIQLYGPHIYPGGGNVIEDIMIYIDENDLEDGE